MAPIRRAAAPRRRRAALACGGEMNGVRLLSEQGCDTVLREVSYTQDLVLSQPIRFGIDLEMAPGVVRGGGKRREVLDRTEEIGVLDEDGGRLVVELLNHGYRVRVLARNPERLKDHPWINKVAVAEGDANDEYALTQAMQGVDVAYYLLHALMSKNDFETKERQLAEHFVKCAKAAGVGRIVYLGGIIAPSEELSPHMQSRADTGEILRASGIPTIELRAAVVIGSGSASFEMLRYLTERLPIMTVPKWVQVRIQPIAVRDVLRYLVGAAAIDPSITGAFDIGGPEIYTYKQMMEKYAEAAGLRKRIIIPVPVLTPRLSSGWVGLVTPVPYTLARRLVASLKNEVVVGDDAIEGYARDAHGALKAWNENKAQRTREAAKAHA